jgi:hypothetical protein
MVQSGEGWNGCVVPKALGAINLDVESRKLLKPLDVFVLFSSAIVEMGNPGKWLPTVQQGHDGLLNSRI